MCKYVTDLIKDFFNNKVQNSVGGTYVTKKTRVDKKIRVNPPLDSETHDLLCRLALACGLSKTALAEKIIDIGVRTPDFVHYLQETNGASRFRVMTMKVDGRTTYIDAKN